MVSGYPGRRSYRIISGGGAGEVGDASGSPTRCATRVPEPCRACQPTFCHELAVNVDDGVAGETEVARQGARGRHQGAGNEPPALHGPSKGPFQRLSHPGAELEVEVDARNGPRFCHGIGPYSRAYPSLR